MAGSESSQHGAVTGLRSLPLADIRPHPGQPRRYFDEEALDDLARSIAQRGVIQPVIVRPRKGGGYELVAGERRWRAAQRARLHEIPAIVRELSDPDTFALALIENIQREDLNPVEEAEAYQRLVGDQGYSPVEVARMVDKSRSHIANLMRLLALPQPVLKMVADRSLSMGHARALINVADAESIAAEVVDRGLSVREVEKLVRRARSERFGQAGRPGTRQARAGRFGKQCRYRGGRAASGGSAGPQGQDHRRCQSAQRQRDRALWQSRPARPDLPAPVRRDYLVISDD